MSMSGHQQHGSADKVWLTPPEIINNCGPFDLDPCYSAPRPIETAAKYYGLEDGDGLSLPWDGLVFCNPPYDQKAFHWLNRCAEHGSAIALIFARTETEQFHRQVWEKADAVLFLEGRLYFHHPDGTRANNSGGAPSVLVAYGEKAVARLSRCGLKGKFIKINEAGT